MVPWVAPADMRLYMKIQSYHYSLKDSIRRIQDEHLVRMGSPLQAFAHLNDRIKGHLVTAIIGRLQA